MPERKSIFITGAASGIGLATAKRFAKEGWFVGLADVNRAGLASALAAIGSATQAGTNCGSCRPAIARLLEATLTDTKEAAE